MATSVKVSEETKDRIEQLQAKIRSESGTRVTQAELLDRIVAVAFETREELFDSFSDEWEGLSEEEIEQWLSGTTASGNPVEKSLDEVFYGDSYLEKKLGMDSDE